MTHLDDNETSDAMDALAGEYVLGTLDAAERRSVTERLAREPALAAAVMGWDNRLRAMNASTAAIAPPPDLFARIETAIARAGARPDRTVERTAERGHGGAGPNVIDLQKRIQRWKFATVAASAMAASFAMLAVFRDVVLPPRPQNFVAAFVKDDQLPSFMLTIDLATRELTIRPIGAEKLAGKTYQLWIASDRIGPAPRSLGVLDDGSSALQRKTLSDYDPNLLQTATFGVSVEQAGGSTTGRPSAGALHAKLLPAKP
jgi:anti-sigma-K factor RskA